MRDEVLGSVAQVGAGMSELRLDAHLDAVQAVARYMDLIKLACLIERRPREEELASAIGEINQVLSHVAERRAARGVPGLQPRLAADGRRAREPASRGAAGRAQEPFAGVISAVARLGPDAVGDRHRRLPLVPAALQVRARLLDPARADAAAAVRDPGASGARALPLAARERGGIGPGDARDAGARAARDPVRGGLAPRRLQRLQRGAPAPRQGRRGARALPGALHRRGRLAGLVRAQLRVPHRPAPAARPRRPRRPPARTAPTS